MRVHCLFSLNHLVWLSLHHYRYMVQIHGTDAWYRYIQQCSCNLNRLVRLSLRHYAEEAEAELGRRAAAAAQRAAEVGTTSSLNLAA